MNRHTRLLLLTALMVCILAMGVSAQVPGTMNYQGRLTDSLGNAVPDGAYNVTFTISNLPEGLAIAYWSSVIEVQVTNGLFSCILGESDPIPYTAVAGERTIGAVQALNKIGGDFTAGDGALLQEVADHLSMALDNILLNSEIVDLSAELDRQVFFLDQHARLARVWRCGRPVKFHVLTPL